MLFPSILQGEKAIHSIIYQLKRIIKVRKHFDVVAIIRGGGGDVGLSCYNNLELSREIALFPIPVITGIGHATNETVVEMISFSNAITPTKIAEYLIQKFHNYSVPVQKAHEIIKDKSRRMIQDEKTKIQSEAKLFRSVTGNILMENRNRVNNYLRSLVQVSVFRFKNENTKIKSLEKDIGNLSPENVLKRGYSITSFKGKAIKSHHDLREGDLVDTKLSEGQFKSAVIMNSIQT